MSKGVRCWVRFVAAGAVILAGCAGARTPPTSRHASSARFPLIVTTDRGAVQGAGTPDGQVENFLGIPYAAAPVGPLRWRAPRSASPWRDVRAAEHYADPCPQPSSGDGPSSDHEDCLYINVQRPSGGNARQRLPVYVYIHGGGLVTSGGSYYDMAEIVRETGVIGVTFNYRLGVLGFLAHPALNAEQGESGNYGLQDQQAALRWIRRNISAFGGDPARVTVGGESAGGWSVCAHLVAPGSQGLFARAMIQSGACPAETRAEADEAGTSFAATAGCTTRDAHAAAACLRALPVRSLIQGPGAGFAPLFVERTKTLPANPRAAIHTGAFVHVPVLVGANRDEDRSFETDNIGSDRVDYKRWVRSTFGADAGAVLARYGWPAAANQFTAAYRMAAIRTDSGTGAGSPTLQAGIGDCGTQSLIQDLARHSRVYAYEWAPSAGPGLENIPGYNDAAGHGSELAYLWPDFKENDIRISSLFNQSERQLAHQVVGLWGAFARTGSPQVAGLPSWPTYSG